MKPKPDIPLGAKIDLAGAIAAVRSGQVAEAQRLAEQILAKDEARAEPHAFLGMLHGRSGRLAEAVACFERAHALKPDDVTIALNLINALADSDQTERAFAVARRDLAFADPSLRVARWRGYLAQASGDFQSAIEAYDYVVERCDADFDCWNNLGTAWLALGNHERSAMCLRAAVALRPDSAPAAMNLAAALEGAGRVDEAVQVLRQAADVFPADPEPLKRLYRLLKDIRQQEEALEALEEAAVRNPGDPEIQLTLGIEYGITMRTLQSKQAYTRALDLKPGMSEAYLGLAIHHEHRNRDDKLRELLEPPRSEQVPQGALAFVRALVHRRAGRFDDALAALAEVDASIEPLRTTHLRGMLLDRLGRHDDAFRSFDEANRMQWNDPSAPLFRAAQLREQLRSELDLLTPSWCKSWSPVQARRKGADPVFIVGFPRSGTTLLDTMLMGHPEISVFEEHPSLNRIELELGGVTALPTLTPRKIADARARYFEALGAARDDPKTLIDKSPLFLSKVPLIHRLFPNAKFILALRHPCDALLSCFMANFRLNSAMANFLRLEDAAEFYDLTFRHWSLATAVMPCEVHQLCYEDLIADPRGELMAICDFLRVEWDDRLLEHEKTARARGLITTASYSQVTEPIYQRSCGRWRSYRDHLEGVLPRLSPWAERFGYSLEKLGKLS